MSKELLFGAVARVALQNRNRRPTWVTAEVPAIVGGYAMRPFQLTGQDVDGRVTYSVVGGTLPTGVSLSPSGVLTGTPSQHLEITNYVFTARTTDDVGAYIDKSFTLTVTPAMDISPVNLTYTGYVIPWVAPITATYTFVLNGGGGGGGGNGGQGRAGAGSAGAKNTSQIYAVKGDTIYIYIGGKGTNGSNIGSIYTGGGTDFGGPGGWPNGKKGLKESGNYSGGGGNGGSTYLKRNGAVILAASGGIGGIPDHWNYISNTYLESQLVQNDDYPNGTLRAGAAGGAAYASGSHGSVGITW